MDLGVWGKHGKSAREMEQSPVAMVCHLPKGDSWAWGKKTRRPFDGKHLGLSGPQAVDGGGGRKMKGLETGGGGDSQVDFWICS